jgi:thiamine pyrophosphate-dependent acetolactate synthase large subunit-like protein
MPKNVCGTLLDILAEVGVRQIFSMTGDALNPLLDAIRCGGRFECIGVHDKEPGSIAIATQSTRICNLSGQNGGANRPDHLPGTIAEIM